MDLVEEPGKISTESDLSRLPDRGALEGGVDKDSFRQKSV